MLTFKVVKFCCYAVILFQTLKHPLLALLFMARDYIHGPTIKEQKAINGLQD